MSDTLTKASLTLTPTHEQEGEKLLIRTLFQRWGVKRTKKYTNLQEALASDETPCNVRLVWHNKAPDIWKLMGQGGNVREDTTEFAALEQKLRQGMRQNGIDLKDLDKQVPAEFVGVAFRVGDHFFIYATEYFPTLEVSSAEERPGEHPIAPENRLGGVFCFSAGAYAVRRIIFPEHLADYGRPIKKKTIVSPVK